MDTLSDLDSKPSTSNILKRFYTKVISLEEHLHQTVSITRFRQIAKASRKNEIIRKLITTTLVCTSPIVSFDEDDDDNVGEHTSLLSTGDHATQAEVGLLLAMSYLPFRS
jgi:hypothetical protein